jgi:hypothetical protein
VFDGPVNSPDAEDVCRGVRHDRRRDDDGREVVGDLPIAHPDGMTSRA